jgi:hypothetical protein
MPACSPADPTARKIVRYAGGGSGLLNWLLALIGLIGVVQTIVWIGRSSTPAGRRVLGVFAAPIAVIVLLLGLAGVRVPGLMF